jgi:uncharacterized protein
MTALLVSIYLNEGDKWMGRPLHMALLRVLADEGIAGATVVRGVAGYTKERRGATTLPADAGTLLPLVMEFVESEANVERILPKIQEMVGRRLVTTSEVKLRSGGTVEP